MIVEIVSTGTELLLGQIVNTNAPYLARRLNDLGFDAVFQTTVGDNRRRMSDVMKIAMGRADIIITSGGLGPTQGDITKEVSAELLDRPMLLHEESVEHIRLFFERRKLPMPENNYRQAMIPKDAIVLRNFRGTAPGVIIENIDKTIIHLPGPPHELEHMFEKSVLPYLLERFGQQGIIVSKVLRVFGIGESALEEKIKDYILAQTNPTIALLARSGEIHVRLTAKHKCSDQARILIAQLEEKIRQRIDPFVFGVDEQSLEQTVGALLNSNGLTLSVAESCTGGLISAKLTDVPGSSAYFVGGLVAYSNIIKEKELGIDAELLISKGAVSPEVAIAMAEGIRRKFMTTLGVGVTGIAGPAGAGADKPVGLVYIAISGEQGEWVEEERFNGQRASIKNRTANFALDMIRHYVQRDINRELV